MQSTIILKIDELEATKRPFDLINYFLRIISETNTFKRDLACKSTREMLFDYYIKTAWALNAHINNLALYTMQAILEGVIV